MSENSESGTQLDLNYTQNQWNWTSGQQPQHYTPEMYAQYYQYYLNYAASMQQQQHQSPVEDVEMPPLPSDPPPPQTTSQKSFGGIKFNLSQPKKVIGAPNPLTLTHSLPPMPTAGGKKKRRKKNKNNQNNQNNQLQNQPQNPFLNQPVLPDLTRPPPNFIPQQVATVAPSPQPLLVAPVKEPSPPKEVGFKKPNPFNNPSDTWPQSLNEYVARCYAKCETDLDKDQVDICLKGKITAAANRNELWTRDWDNEPMPSVHSERARNALIASNSSPVINSNTPASNKKPSLPNENTPNSKFNSHSANKKNGISKGLNARLGYKRTSSVSKSSRDRSRSYSKSRSRSTSRSRSSRSRSRSNSSSPRRKIRRSDSSSNSGADDFISINSGNSGSNKKNHFKNNSKNKGGVNSNSGGNNKKAPFYSNSIGGKIDSDSDRLKQRAARFSQQGNSNKKTVTTSTSSSSNLSAQKQKNNSNHSNYGNVKCQSSSRLYGRLSFVDDSVSGEPDSNFDLADFHIVGTCRDLEKSFLRLTKAPLPSEVRPIDVLQHSLTNVKTKWKEGNGQDYYYACDQLKSIRQDLTVQGIRNEFTVEVYETHARIAIEKGDHEEFNQCQTQLKMLYHEVGGSKNILEFTAYRILYYIFTKNTLDITTVLRSLSTSERENPTIAHALKVRSAWAFGNYCLFFKLYKEAELMAGFLMDWFLERERKSTLKTIVKV
ncbi:LENG8 family protein [Megaselia abdita]